jgi:hypothetical protein
MIYFRCIDQFPEETREFLEFFGLLGFVGFLELLKLLVYNSISPRNSMNQELFFLPAEPLSNTVLMEIPNQQGRRIGWRLFFPVHPAAPSEMPLSFYFTGVNPVQYA